MNVIILGNGNIGKMHQRIWSSIPEVKVHIVDPNRSTEYYSLDMLPEYIFSEQCIFDVCTPTEQHLTSIIEITKSTSFAKILVEKPFCLPSQANEAREMLSNLPKEISLHINDQYQFSSPVRFVSHFLKDNDLKIKKINIEFSKHRLSDERNGRFIDNELMSLGYEWFHMLTIISQLIDRHVFDDLLMLNCSPLYMTSSCGLYADFLLSTQVDEVQIGLASSMRGSLAFPPKNDLRGCFSFISSFARQIPKDSLFRYRMIDITTTCGKQINICYEPERTKSGDRRNIHKIIFDGKVFEVEDNHLENSLLNVYNSSRVRNSRITMEQCLLKQNFLSQLINRYDLQRSSNAVMLTGTSL